jgi:hypothetical protein
MVSSEVTSPGFARRRTFLIFCSTVSPVIGVGIDPRTPQSFIFIAKANPFLSYMYRPALNTGKIKMAIKFFILPLQSGDISGF